MKKNDFSGRGFYEIRVKGQIDETWSSWFEDMDISTDRDEGGTIMTTFTGQLNDQATLHGVLARIRDINMLLISVNRITKTKKGKSDNPKRGTNTE